MTVHLDVSVSGLMGTNWVHQSDAFHPATHWLGSKMLAGISQSPRLIRALLVIPYVVTPVQDGPAQGMALGIWISAGNAGLA